MFVTATSQGKTALYRKHIKRLDIGIPVPDDGYQYFMIRHELDLLGKTRFENDPRNQENRPAIVNKDWGINTGYYEVQPEWQFWFRDFWDYHSGKILPMGVKIGEYTLPKNSKDIIYWRYTAGSKLEVYARMTGDATGWTDGSDNAPETGGKCVVQKRNLDTGKRYWKWLCRPTTGALVRGRRNGSKLIVDAIDITKSPPDIESLPLHLFYFSTQVSPDGSVTRFPVLKNAMEVHGFPPIGTPNPLVAVGGKFELNYSAVIPMQAGQMWKPYYQ